MQETPITFKLNLFAYLNIEFNSDDSPETLNINNVSSFDKKPNPPCCKSFALNPTAGEPKLDKVLATFREIMNDFPTPTTTILFFVLLHKFTAFENCEEWLKLADNFFSAIISVLTVFFAICKSVFI